MNSIENRFLVGCACYADKLTRLLIEQKNLELGTSLVENGFVFGHIRGKSAGNQENSPQLFHHGGTEATEKISPQTRQTDSGQAQTDSTEYVPSQNGCAAHESKRGELAFLPCFLWSHDSQRRGTGTSALRCFERLAVSTVL